MVFQGKGVVQVIFGGGKIGENSGEKGILSTKALRPYPPLF